MMKYVCFKNEELGFDEVMVFPATINHNCFAEGVSRIKNQTTGQWHRVTRTPVSAGFVTFLKDKAVCFGKSITLNLESREEDTLILNKQLGN